jgi:hypothetical protein
MPPTLVGVSIPENPAEDERDALEAAMAAAVANAAAGGVDIGADEQALIRLHQTGGIDDEEFLRRARALAERKAAQLGDVRDEDQTGKSDG